MFVAGIFTEIRPLWVGDLENRPKNLKSLCLGLILPFISWDFCFSAVVYSAKKNCKLGINLIWNASMFTCLALKKISLKNAIFKKLFSAVGYRAKDFFALSATALKNL
jgi:hypothetical protein